MELYKGVPIPLYAFGYRVLQRTMHRFHLHYMRPHVMEDGATMRWCHWCGARHRESPQRRPGYRDYLEPEK